MNRCRFAGLHIEWDTGDLPFDPFGPVMPLALGDAIDPAPTEMTPAPALTLTAARLREPSPSPDTRGALPVLFHGGTRCFSDNAELLLWDGASLVRISSDGSRIDAAVHEASLARPFLFSSVTVMMALLLALRHHGLFHLHAAAARWPDGATWLVPGESGSGKSTLALALFGAGALWLSDDAVLLRSADGALEIVGWSRMIRMTTQTADAFPALRPLLTPCAPGSARDFEVDPRQAFSGRGLALATPPFVLLYPRIARAPESRVVALDQAEAFGHALHACAWVASEHLPRRDEQRALLARMVGIAPAFALHTGTRLLHEPAAEIAAIRARVGASVPDARA